MPNPDKELTVEECLAELREMFPSTTLQVDASAWHWTKDGEAADSETEAKVVVGFDESKTFYAVTLGEAMAQVREWKALNND